jgi:hypothetical protein
MRRVVFSRTFVFGMRIRHFLFFLLMGVYALVSSCASAPYDVIVVDEHNASTSGARLVFHEEGKMGSVPLGALLPIKQQLTRIGHLVP